MITVGTLAVRHGSCKSRFILNTLNTLTRILLCWLCTSRLTEVVRAFWVWSIPVQFSSIHLFFRIIWTSSPCCLGSIRITRGLCRRQMASSPVEFNRSFHGVPIRNGANAAREVRPKTTPTHVKQPGPNTYIVNYRYTVDYRYRCVWHPAPFPIFWKEKNIGKLKILWAHKIWSWCTRLYLRQHLKQLGSRVDVLLVRYKNPIVSRSWSSKYVLSRKKW